MTTIELFNLGLKGLEQDQEDYTLEPEAWTNGRNVRFDKRGVSRMAGHEQVFGSMQVSPFFIFNVPGTQGSFWFYGDLNKIYVIEAAVHTNVTRQTGGVDVNYTAVNGREWQGSIFGGIPIINNGRDIPQFWADFNVTTKLQDLTDWPSTLRAKVVKAFGPYLIALNLTDNGDILSHSLRWSHKADPGTIPSSWAINDPTVDSGQTHLTDVQGGVILDAVVLGNQLIIYKETSTHTLRFVGGNDIFSPDLILSTAGLLAPKCATAFAKGTRHFVVTEDDVIVHAGTKEADSILEDRMKRQLFRELDSTYYENTFTFDNQKTRECWICYPESGSEFPTKALIWNYKDNTCTFRDFHGRGCDLGAVFQGTPLIWDDVASIWNTQSDSWSNAAQSQFVFVDGVDAFALDQGYAFGTETPTAFVERTGISIDGKDRFGKPKGSIDSVKLLSRIWPKISGNSPVNVQVGVQEKLGASMIWSDPQVYIPGTTEWLDFEVSGKLLGYRFEANSNLDWVLHGLDLEIIKLSRL